MRKILLLSALVFGSVSHVAMSAAPAEVVLSCTLKSPEGTPVVGGHLYQLVRKNNKHFIVISNPSVGPADQPAELQVSHYARYGKMISAISGPSRGGYALIYYNANQDPPRADDKVKEHALVDINMFLNNDISVAPMNESEVDCKLAETK